jgi:hypothetical protein
MKNRKALGWTLACASTALLAACATKKTGELAQGSSSEGRSPASMIGANTRSGPYVYNANQPNPLPAAAPSPSGQPFVPTDPKKHSPSPTPTPDPNAPVDVPQVTACLSQRVPGTSFTVQNVLAGLKLVPGRDVITLNARTGRADVFYIDWATDPDLLRPIFQTESQAGSDFAKMAQHSESFRRALNFVNGTGRSSQGYTAADYVRDARTAWILSILIAFKGDRECVRHVLEDSEKIIGPVAADLRSLPFLEASQLAADGLVGESWAQIEEQRQLREQTRQDLEVEKQEIEFRHESEMLDLTAQLDSAEQSLRLELMTIPGCSPKVSKTRTSRSLEAYRRAAGLSVDERKKAVSDARALIAACRREIYEQKAKELRKEVKLREILARQQAKRKADPMNPGEPTEDENQTLEKLAAVKERTELLQAYLERLSMDVDSSLGTQLDEIQRLQGEVRTKKREDIYGDISKQQRELDAADKKDAPNWLTQGVFGGFRQNGF